MSVPRGALGLRADRGAAVDRGAEVVGMAFVHGHGRATGWVVAHVRRPNRAEGDQLSLLADVPAREEAGAPVDRGSGGTGPPSASLISLRKSAITRS